MATEAVAPPPGVNARIADAWRALDGGDVDLAIATANGALPAVSDDDRPWARLVLAHAARARDDVGGASDQVGRAFEDFLATGSREGQGRALTLVGAIALGEARVDAAAAALARALELLGDGPALDVCVATVATLADQLGDTSSARRLRMPVSGDRSARRALARARCNV